MSTDTIRIGIVGAGANTRLRHVPGFRANEGVELTGVVNRSRESSERAAAEFEIPRVYDTWQDLVADDEIDAVMIGGVEGPSPCPLCNGKGVRVMFGKESKCEWCDGKGFVDEGAV